MGGVPQGWAPGQRPCPPPGQLPVATARPVPPTPCHGLGSLGKVSEVSTRDVRTGWLCLHKESGGGPKGQ